MLFLLLPGLLVNRMLWHGRQAPLDLKRIEAALGSVRRMLLPGGTAKKCRSRMLCIRQRGAPADSRSRYGLLTVGIQFSVGGDSVSFHGAGIWSAVDAADPGRSPGGVSSGNVSPPEGVRNHSTVLGIPGRNLCQRWGTTAGIPEPYTSNAGSFYMKMYLIARSGVVAFYAPCGLEYYKRIEVIFRGNASIWLNYVACG